MNRHGSTPWQQQLRWQLRGRDWRHWIPVSLPAPLLLLRLPQRLRRPPLRPEPEALPEGGPLLRLRHKGSGTFAMKLKENHRAKALNPSVFCFCSTPRSSSSSRSAPCWCSWWRWWCGFCAGSGCSRADLPGAGSGAAAATAGGGLPGGGAGGPAEAVL